MIVGVLQAELLIHDAESLKDKRRVVHSLRDRLHREHLVSFAEIAQQDNPAVAIVGITLTGTDGSRVGNVLDKVTSKMRALTEAELGAASRRLIEIDPMEPEAVDSSDLEELARELVERGEGASP